MTSAKAIGSVPKMIVAAGPMIAAMAAVKTSTPAGIIDMRPVRYVAHGARPYYDEGGYERGYRGSVSYDYRCRNSGATGAIVGALAGGLLGSGLAGRGDRTLGTLLGGGAGALAGRAIDRSNNGC